MSFRLSPLPLSYIFSSIPQVIKFKSNLLAREQVRERCRLLTEEKLFHKETNRIYKDDCYKLQAETHSEMKRKLRSQKVQEIFQIKNW